MDNLIKYHLPVGIDCVVCVLLTPLLHGLRENGLEVHYGIDDLRNAVLIEFIIRVADAWDKAILFTLHNILSGVSLFALAAEFCFGWTLNTYMTIFAVHLGIRSLLLEIIRLVKESMKNSFLLWVSKVTNLQWTFYIASRITRVFLVFTLTVCILILRVTVIPKLFIPNSPVFVRPQSPTEAILWTPVGMENKVIIDEDIPEFKTNYFARLPGEDILMVCRLSAEYYPSSVDMKAVWKFNRKKVKNDKRHTISSYRLKDNHIFQLTLTDIQRSDYGEYKCYLQTSPTSSDIETNRIRLFEIRTLYLVERVDAFLSVEAAIGAAINIEDVFIYNVIRNKTSDGQNEVDWLYTINGMNFSKVCPLEDSMKLWTVDYKSMEYPLPVCAYKAAEYICNFSFIVCPSGYGLHEFAVVKTDMAGNSSIKHLSTKIVLLPEKTPISNQIDYDIYKQLDKDFRLDPSIKHKTRFLQLVGAKEASEKQGRWKPGQKWSCLYLHHLYQGLSVD